MEEFRKKIDEIDRELVRLFTARMDVCDKIGEYKKRNSLPVFDPVREKALIERVRGLAGPNHADEIERVYKTILALSKERQSI